MGKNLNQPETLLQQIANDKIQVQMCNWDSATGNILGTKFKKLKYCQLELKTF